MIKKYLPLVMLTLFVATARAQLAQPVIQRDDKGVVTITCASPDTIICYTLDGSEPELGAGAGLYLAPITLPFKGVVRAKAFARSDAAVERFEALNGVATPPSTVIPVTQNRNWALYDWQKRHESLCALVKERKPALIFIGDSITHFMGGDAVNKGNDVWLKYYAPRNAVNLGFGWDRTENVLWRLQHGELDGYEPKVAVVMIGTNNRGINTPADIATGIKAICAEVRQHSPNTKILLLGVFPRAEKPEDPARKITQDVNDIISKFDGQDGITYLDIGKKFLNPDGTISKDVMNDFLHPTLKGYGIWAEAMEETLKKLLNDKS